MQNDDLKRVLFLRDNDKNIDEFKIITRLSSYMGNARWEFNMLTDQQKYDLIVRKAKEVYGIK